MSSSASLHKEINHITENLIERSKKSREDYLARMSEATSNGPTRNGLGCSNLAHGFAACSATDKSTLIEGRASNLAIISAYNDMLSAHQPFDRFPELIKEAAHEMGAIAQVAGCVPAMCDGVTQGELGMELSLFSRDVIAMSAAIGLSHNMFDAAVYLGVCDKIIPGLMIGALSFGHLPAVFLPAGPMPSGLPNDEKAKVRQLYAEGKVDRTALLKSESAAYHAPGTCTFYGTANSNQMLMEIMGLHLPGATFVNPNTPLRDALTKEGAKQAISLTAEGNAYTPLCNVVDEKAVINGVIGLHATGGSTNHTLHLIAIARAAGVQLTWEDIGQLSELIPLIARVYPNGLADVNHFHAAGGMGYLIHELLNNGMLHEEVTTIMGKGLSSYLKEPRLDENDNITWANSADKSGEKNILATVDKPFSKNGGLKILTGNLGKAVSKISAVKEERHIIEAPAKIFHSQAALNDAFKAGKLEQDFIAVVSYQGPKANGMPELHKLTPILGVLQDRGIKVALVTDGRMSGASGKIPSAIQVTPEAYEGGPIAKIQEGDMIRFDATAGTLELLVDEAELAKRQPAKPDLSGNDHGMGRELFANLRRLAGAADSGAGVF